LAAYLEGDLETIPTVAMIDRPLEAVRARVARWREHLAAQGVAATVVETAGAVGGGTAPESPLASAALALEGDVERLAQALRAGDPPIVARIQEDRLLLDGRTVLPDEEAILLARLVEVLGGAGAP